MQSRRMHQSEFGFRHHFVPPFPKMAFASHLGERWVSTSGISESVNNYMNRKANSVLAISWKENIVGEDTVKCIH